MRAVKQDGPGTFPDRPPRPCQGNFSEQLFPLFVSALEAAVIAS